VTRLRHVGLTSQTMHTVVASEEKNYSGMSGRAIDFGRWLIRHLSLDENQSMNQSISLFVHRKGYKNISLSTNDKSVRQRRRQSNALHTEFSLVV